MALPVLMISITQSPMLVVQHIFTVDVTFTILLLWLLYTTDCLIRLFMVKDNLLVNRLLRQQL